MRYVYLTVACGRDGIFRCCCDIVKRERERESETETEIERRREKERPDLWQGTLNSCLISISMYRSRANPLFSRRLMDCFCGLYIET